MVVCSAAWDHGWGWWVDLSSLPQKDSMTYDDLFHAATGRSPYPWQRQLGARTEPARAVLAPTGSGKTEAILLNWLWRRVFHPDQDERRRTPRRLVFALPMRVLVEQTVKRVTLVLNRLTEARLVGQPISAYPLMGGAADDSWILGPASEAVLVGTIDMLISRALNRGFGRARASWPIDFGLLNNDCLWVFDEVQLMDAAVATSCQLQALRRRFGVAAPAQTVWMSATLDRSWLATTDHDVPGETQLAQIDDEDRSGPLGQRLRAPKLLVREEVDPANAAAVALVVLREHGLLANAADAPRLTVIVTNAVERAIALHAALKSMLPLETDLLLLHSRFRPADRERLVAHLDEPLPAGGRIVVSTQVIEAGIDLDAGALVTEPAPWASVVQRAGRLNRTGGRQSSPARLVWLDPGEQGLRGIYRPYELEALEAARSALLELDGGSFTPEHIADFVEADGSRSSRLLGARPFTLLLRAPDLVDLFDTDATLDGDDADVGRFIRADEDLDVGIAWRHLPAGGPTLDEPIPGRAEVCPVPVWEKKRIVALSPWRWSYARRRWERLTTQDDIVPGDLFLLDAGVGGYSSEIGWTGRKGDRVVPVASDEGGQGDTDADDALSVHPGRWVTLAEHAADVLAEVNGILQRIDLDEESAEALRTAALAHDVGKAHKEFRQRLRRWAGADSPDDQIYAKAPQRQRWRPRFAFRHELVSALLLLERGGRSRDLDLAAYLVASHHGKLRLTPRLLLDDQNPGKTVCLGVAEGDEVPEVMLDGERFGPLRIDLSLLRIGDLEEVTWIERALDLRDRLGVFRLAYLEALLRVADQRASEKERHG